MQREDLQKSIARGEGFLVFSILLATLVRVGYYFYNDDHIVSSYPHTGYLWDLIEPFSQDPLYSLIGASVGVILLAAVVSVMNVKHLIIRERTLLPAAFVFLLFSCHPIFLTVNPYLIGTFFFLWALSAMLGSYQIKESAFACAHICFILALGSLFVSYFLLFYILFLIGFKTMRILNLKSFIAGSFSFLVVYIPIFTFYLLTDNIEAFYLPFSFVSLDAIAELPFFSFDVTEWVFIGFGVFLLITISISNYLNRHKDRIKTREFILFFSLLATITIFMYVFLNIQPSMALYVCFIAGSILQAHFFALIKNKYSLILFILCLIFYLLACYMYVLHPITLQTIILLN